MEIRCSRPAKAKTALYLAIQAGSWDSVRTLLELGANPNIKTTAGETPLHLMVNLRLGKYCTNAYEEINIDEQAALQVAIKNKVDYIKLLAQCGVDLNAKNAQGKTALCTAILKGYWESVHCLLELGADPKDF